MIPIASLTVAITAKDYIIQQADANGSKSGFVKSGITLIDALFNSFCNFLKSHCTYNATGGRSGVDRANTLLNLLTTETMEVDCSAVAQAFVIILQEHGFTDAKRVGVDAPTTWFATKERGNCFDNRITGNMRTINSDFRSIGRCVFRSHYFVKVADTFYDPCLITTYNTEQEVKTLTAIDVPLNGVKGYYEKVYKFKEDPTKFAIKIPNITPTGFQSAYLLCNIDDWDPFQRDLVFPSPTKISFKDNWQTRHHGLLGGMNYEKPTPGTRYKSINDFLAAAGCQLYI